METLAVLYQPRRYVVTNTEKIILVTYDFKLAYAVSQAIMQQDDPEKFYMKQ